MTRLHLILRLEGPELDHDGADDDVVGDGVVCERGQDVFRTVGHPINDILDALVLSGIPDLDNFVGAQTDQMVPLLVNVQVADRSVMTIQVGELLQSIRLPENDMSLLTATSDLLVLD